MSSRIRIPLALSSFALVAALGLTGCTPAGSDDSATAPAPAPASPTDNAEAGSGTSRSVEAALEAISAAEDEAGGTAFELDDSDDADGWKVSVWTGSSAVEVRVADGGTVVSSDPDDDDDDRRVLDGAGITLADAIGAASAEFPDATALESVSVTDDGAAWEVSFDDDTEVEIAASDGSVRTRG